MADSVINCNPNKDSILKAIKKVYSSSFKKKLISTINPYGKGGASKSILKKIKTISLNNILKKNFYDLEFK